MFHSFVSVSGRYGSSYGYSGYCYSGSSSSSSSSSSKTFFFYEWSDLTRRPLVFKEVKAFIAFLEKSGIKYTVTQMVSMNNEDLLWCSCPNGKSELLSSMSFYGLKRQLEKESSSASTVVSVVVKQ
jgi:hypothetical protein